jgi:hypothetical protein
MSKIILSLTDKVEEQFGYPRQWFKPGANLKFVTVKEFIDNPKTVETWRFLNSYNNDIKFSNEVYEYIDKRFFTKRERAERKKVRDLQRR